MISTVGWKHCLWLFNVYPWLDLKRNLAKKSLKCIRLLKKMMCWEAETQATCLMYPHSLMRTDDRLFLHCHCWERVLNVCKWCTMPNLQHYNAAMFYSWCNRSSEWVNGIVSAPPKRIQRSNVPQLFNILLKAEFPLLYFPHMESLLCQRNCWSYFKVLLSRGVRAVSLFLLSKIDHWGRYVFLWRNQECPCR